MLLKLTPFQVRTVDWIIERVLYLRQPYENEVLDFLIVDSCSTICLHGFPDSTVVCQSSSSTKDQFLR